MLELNAFQVDTQPLMVAGLRSEPSNSKIDRPVVVALHGWLDNAASFIPLAQHLAGGYDFYAMELPGHGHSEHRPAGCAYHLIDNIVNVLSFMDAIAPEGQVILLGHSLGGIVASLVAASAPERVSQLILLDSLGPLTDELSNVLPQLRKAVRKATMLRPSNMTIYPTLEKMAQVRTKGVGLVSLEAARLLVERGAKQVDGGYCWRSDPRLMAPSLLRLSEGQVEVLFLGIECPVLLICGETGYFSDYAMLEKRWSYIRLLDKHHVPGGHHFHMDGDVEQAARLIDHFVEEGRAT